MTRGNAIDASILCGQNESIVGKPAARDTTTVAIGPRFHFKAGGLWLRPGLSYAAALDSPAKDLGYHIVQLDVPVVF